MTSTTTIPDDVIQAIEQALQLRHAAPEGKEIRFLAPCHDDQDPSARWNPDKHTWYCDVCKHGGGYKHLAGLLGVSLPTAPNGSAKQIECTYDYVTASGDLLYQVVRYTPKDFRQRRPNGKGGWIWDVKGIRPVAYQLPNLAGQPRVYKPEGEKDVERLRSVGLSATCNAGGAGKWTDELTQHVKAAGVHEMIILPDNDETGHQDAQSVAKSCAAVGLAVKIITLPNLPPKGDVSDWFDSGKTVEDLNALVEAASCWTPEVPGSAVPTIIDIIEPVGVRLTDVGNGELFARQHREHVRYCYGLKQWFVWDGPRWKPDDGGGMTRLAKQTALSLYERAANEPDEHRRKALAKWAAESETERRLTSMVSLARSEPGIAIEAENLDADPLLLTVLNGTLDLRTGTLRPARREDFITKLAPVDYRPDAVCPEFERMLNRLFEHVPAVRQYLQRIFGYAMTGLTIEQCFFIFHGMGSNGKSTILNAILDLLGEYADASRPETFMIKRHDGSIPNDVAALTGVRYVVSLESEKGQRLAEGLVKGLTGSDKVKARFLYKESFRFTPQFKLFIGTNNKPVIVGTDLGIWRRVRCVPFAVTIPEEEKDRQLPARLLTEGSGIFNWLVQGCLAWQRDGLREPLEILAATAAYRDEQDVLGVFLTERCVLEPTAKTSKKEVFETYVAWCEECGEQKKHRLTMREFGKVLRERGLVDTKVGNAKGWVGLRLRTPLDAALDDNELVAAQPEVFADES